MFGASCRFLVGNDWKLRTIQLAKPNDRGAWILRALMLSEWINSIAPGLSGNGPAQTPI